MDTGGSFTNSVDAGEHIDPAFGPFAASGGHGTLNILRKSVDDLSPRPNMGDYARARRDFHWADARAELSGLPGNGLNIAYEAVDRQVAQGRGEQTAIRWLARNLSTQDISYAELEALTNRFCNMLQRLGVKRGDLDSLDFLNWITAIHKRLSVDVPEVDYQRLSTFEGAVEYVAGKLS